MVRSRLEEAGIQTSLHYPPVHHFSIYESGASLPLTDEYARRAVTLPLFPSISEEQVGLVVEALDGAIPGS
jgi:dTDP-4-amino-4,6-dideoxygalactose transaminase